MNAKEERLFYEEASKKPENYAAEAGEKVFVKVPGLPPWPGKVHGVFTRPTSASGDENHEKVKYIIKLYGYLDKSVHVPAVGCLLHRLFIYNEETKSKYGTPIGLHGKTLGTFRRAMEQVGQEEKEENARETRRKAWEEMEEKREKELEKVNIRKAGKEVKKDEGEGRELADETAVSSSTSARGALKRPCPFSPLPLTLPSVAIDAGETNSNNASASAEGSTTSCGIEEIQRRMEGCRLATAELGKVEKFIQDFSSGLESEVGADLIISVPLMKGSIHYTEKKVHKTILGFRAPLFARKLSEMTKNGRVMFEDLTSKGLRILLKYLYTAEIDDEWIQVVDELITVSAKCGLVELKLFLDGNLLKAVTEDNIGDLFRLTRKYGWQDAQKKIATFAKQNVKKLLEKGSVIKVCEDEDAEGSREGLMLIII